MFTNSDIVIRCAPKHVLTPQTVSFPYAQSVKIVQNSVRGYFAKKQTNKVLDKLKKEAGTPGHMPSLHPNVASAYETVEKYTPHMYRRNSIRIVKTTHKLRDGSGY